MSQAKPIFYEYLAQRMYMHTDLNEKRLTYKRAREIIAWYRIPVELRNKMIRELIDYGLLTRLSKVALFINYKPTEILD